jgi:CRP-like cAMP-binding protein
MFILLDGALELSQKLTLFGADAKDLNSKDKMLNRLNATSRPFVGEMSLFEEHSIRSATMKALGNVTVGVIDKEKLLHLIQGNHHLGFTLFYNIGMALSARLKKANQDILKLTTAFSLALERGW